MSRRSAFTIGMLLVPVLFFVLLESGLRIAGFGQEYPLFVDVPGADGWKTTNRDVARRYFSKQASVPTALGDAFRAEKDSTTFRIVVQGGSSAAGYPYYYGGSFSRMLAQRLQQTYPDRRIEVINTAMAAVNTFTLLDLAPEIIALRPDAILIYAGHNEFYGALGVGSAESVGRFRVLVNLYLRMQDWRTLQLVRSVLARAAGWFASDAATGPPGRTLMERMVAEQKIPLGSPLYRMGLAQFEGNLGDLLDTYASLGIPVYVSTLASNERDHAPFESAPGESIDPETWTRELRAAAGLAASGDTSAALDAFDRLERVDSVDAQVRFARARLLDRSGRFDEARAGYLAAKDRDQLRFRASEDVNSAIRTLAARTGAHVVDGQDALRRSAPGGIIDGTLMLEHLHPNIDGYFLLSDAFYRAIVDDGLIAPGADPVPADQARAELLVTAIDSLYGQYRVRQLLGSWPFKPAGTFDTSLDTMIAHTTSEALALDLHRGKTSWYEATNRLRDAYMQTGDFHRALRASLALVQQYPFMPGPYAYAGEALLRQRRPGEALSYYQAAVDLEESAAVRVVMGDIWSALEDHRRAAEAYEKATQNLPRDVDVGLKLGRAHAMAGNLEASRQAVERLLSNVPGDPRATQALEALRAFQGN